MEEQNNPWDNQSPGYQVTTNPNDNKYSTPADKPKNKIDWGTLGTIGGGLLAGIFGQKLGVNNPSNTVANNVGGNNNEPEKPSYTLFVIIGVVAIIIIGLIIWAVAKK